MIDLVAKIIKYIEDKIPNVSVHLDPKREDWIHVSSGSNDNNPLYTITIKVSEDGSCDVTYGNFGSFVFTEKWVFSDEIFDYIDKIIADLVFNKLSEKE